MRRRLLVPLLAALVLAVPGCGGEEAPGEAADLLRADTALFVALDTDFDGEQWNQVEALVERFPDGDRLGALILDELRQEGIDFEREVRPALGSEAALALVEVDLEAEEPPFVFLAQPDDPEKFDALVRKAEEEGNEVVSREVEGWRVVASTDEVLDGALAGEGETLGDSEAFQAAMDELPDEGLARAYVNGEALAEASAALGQPTGFGSLLSYGGRPEWVSAALTAEGEGVRLEAAEELEDAEGQPEPYEATFVSEVPRDVLGYLSFNQLDKGLRQIRDSLGDSIPGFDRQLAQFEAAFGVSLEDDVLPLLAREGALYVRGAGTIPEVTLVVAAEDEERALATLDELAAAVARTGVGRQAGETESGGVTVKQLSFQGFPLYYAAFDGKLVVTTALGAVGDLREDGEKLADDPLFEEAREAAEMPDETTGFLYVNFEDTVPLVLGFLRGSGEDVAPEVSENLEPLRTLLLYSTRDGERARASALLQIE